MCKPFPSVFGHPSGNTHSDLEVEWLAQESEIEQWLPLPSWVLEDAAEAGGQLWVPVTY